MIGSSLGGIFLAKYLSEHIFPRKILAVLLICTPFDNTLSGEDLVGGFRMTCHMAQYNGELEPSAEAEKMDWFDYSKRGSVSPVDQLIFDDLKAKNLID